MHYKNLKECLHLDDALAAINASPDTQPKDLHS